MTLHRYDSWKAENAYDTRPPLTPTHRMRLCSLTAGQLLQLERARIAVAKLARTHRRRCATATASLAESSFSAIRGKRAVVRAPAPTELGRGGTRLSLLGR